VGLFCALWHADIENGNACGAKLVPTLASKIALSGPIENVEIAARREFFSRDQQPVVAG
jgi:hypothetical protein